MKHEGDDDTNALGKVSKGLEKRLEILEIKRNVETIQTHSIVKTCKNTHKSPGDLRRLAVTQTPSGRSLATAGVKNSQGVIWYMHKPESVLENETHKLLWDFEIQTDHLISARQPNLIIINKKEKKRTCRIVDFAFPVDHRVKLKESQKKD